MRSTSSDRFVADEAADSVAHGIAAATGVVAHDLPEGAVVRPAPRADLRSGSWTRLGSAGVLGDAVTEAMLGELAERAHQAARAQGYAKGWAEGRRVALARAAEEAEQVRRADAADRDRRSADHATALAALDAAVATLDTRTAEALDALAERTVEVALQLAEAIIGREVATAADPGADALRRALAEVPPTVPVTVRMHPEDRAALDPALLAERAGGHSAGGSGGRSDGGTDGRSDASSDRRAVTVVGDPTLNRGDAVAETPDNVVDATLASALERVREVLAR